MLGKINQRGRNKSVVRKRLLLLLSTVYRIAHTFSAATAMQNANTPYTAGCCGVCYHAQACIWGGFNGVAADTRKIPHARGPGRPTKATLQESYRAVSCAKER